MRKAVGWLALLGAMAIAAAPQAAPVQHPSLCNITIASRVVAVGDVHGALNKFTAILREAQLIDGKGRWTGGNAVLVQVGDLLDRGPDSRAALDLIRRLEGESARAGGGVVFLLGNHEVMRMAGDYRYVSAAEYAAFKGSDSSDLRDRLFDHLVVQRTTEARAKGEAFDPAAFRKQFYGEIPLGSVEMQIAFSENGEYGHWLRDHDVMARINGTVFVHGGPAPAFAASCDATNARAHAEMQTLNVNDPNREQTSLWSPEGPFWYRGLVSDPPNAASADDVTAVLKATGGARIVVGHTVSASGRIRSLFDGRVFQIDTGMLGGEFFTGGVPSALEFQGEKITAIYEGKREVLR